MKRICISGITRRGCYRLLPGIPLLLGALPAAQGTEYRVTVHGVASDRGRVLVALCTPQTFLQAGCPFTAAAPARVGSVRVALPDVVPGVYAVQVFHDENDNLDLDRTFLGFPKEAMGFGNDARMRFGPPDFEEAAVRIGPEGGTSELTLKSFD